MKGPPPEMQQDSDGDGGVEPYRDQRQAGRFALQAVADFSLHSQGHGRNGACKVFDRLALKAVELGPSLAQGVLGLADDTFVVTDRQRNSLGFEDCLPCLGDFLLCVPKKPGEIAPERDLARSLIVAISADPIE